MNHHSLTFLSSQERQAVKEFMQRVKRAFPRRVKRMILFGSKARMSNDLDSDIDILLVTNNEDWRFCHAISNIAADVSLDCDVLLEPHVIEQTRWERMRRGRFVLYETVRDEGVALFPL
jgi:predicted nucleotidyltransferase